jgi:cytochrome c oxidase assembly protein subunit 11
MTPSRRRNLKVVVPCVVFIGVMLLLVSYSPTIYREFCAATGLGGTTQRADSDSYAVSDRVVTVRFDSNVAPNLPWRFGPQEREVKVHLGEQRLVFFTAENTSDQAIVGHATFNVTPETTGSYFNKIQCFCFDEERLDAHQKVDMPVVFFVDPALAADSETKDVDRITLSYTFFRSSNPENAKDLSRFLSSAEPDAVHGKQLFGERCAVCHAPHSNKIGPVLDNVFNRKAGSVQGYNYSSALAAANLNWSADNLDRWLADPRKFIPGVRMPIRVLDHVARRDIIAYLETEGSTRAGQPERKSAAQIQLINSGRN